ncbi:hypothetical protein JCM12296A_60520 [Desulfosarcina cetonica]
MIEPSRFEKTYWSLFNFVSRKVMGILFILIPSIFLVTLLLDDNKEWYSSDTRVLIYILVAIFIILGFLLLKIKPYYPKKYQNYYFSIGKIK